VIGENNGAGSSWTPPMKSGAVVSIRSFWAKNAALSKAICTPKSCVLLAPVGLPSKETGGAMLDLNSKIAGLWARILREGAVHHVACERSPTTAHQINPQRWLVVSRFARNRQPFELPVRNKVGGDEEFPQLRALPLHDHACPLIA